MALPFITPNELDKVFKALSRRIDALEESGLVVPENVSAFKNDVGYITKADLAGYATKGDLEAVRGEIPSSDDFATSEQLTELTERVDEVAAAIPDPESAVVFEDLGVGEDGTKTVRLASPIPPLPEDYESVDYDLAISGGKLVWEPRK